MPTTHNLTSRTRALSFAAALGLLAWSPGATAQCPVGTKITIDYDIPGSGYSETSNNWASWSSLQCNGSGYRYLSFTVGDGSRRGKAIWKPNVTVAGHYRVTSGYRATVNRTNDADYFSYDDQSGTVHKVVDQTTGDGCLWVDLGVSWCVPGGACRVELDGTDDDKSDCADVTTYELRDCDIAAGGTGGTGSSTGGAGGGTGTRCAGIGANPAWEVCEETDTTCKGVFTDGAGCVAYCAAAGMTCTARFGGSPGCLKEPQNVLGCADNNGNVSDWCECEGPSLQQDAGTGGAGGTGGIGGTGGTGGTGGIGGTGGAGGTGGVAGNAGAGGTVDAGWPAMGGMSSDAGAAGPSGSAVDGTGSAQDDGGCSCRTGSKPADLAWLVAALAIVRPALRRKRRG